MMRRLLTIAMSTVSSSAIGQVALEPDVWIDQWSSQNKVYVTSQLRKAAPEVRGFSTNFGTLMSSWIVRFPTIRIVVQPSPPRDYRISINDEDCPPTERSVYKVPIGITKVRVERVAHPPCLWEGNLIDGRVYDVRCNF
jgi:hypothetical protein